MKTMITNKRNVLPMVLTLLLVLVAVSAMVIMADTPDSAYEGPQPPYIQVRHEEVGGDIYRMVVAAKSSDNIAVFGVAMSFNNNIVRPVSSNDYSDIGIIADWGLHVGDGEAFYLLPANVQEIPNVWLVRGDRTGFSFGGFTLGGIDAQEYTDLFAFYYRLAGDMAHAGFRFENAEEENSMLGGPGQGQTAFLHPGILLGTREASFAWGPNVPNHSYTVIPSVNITQINMDGEVVAVRPQAPLYDELNAFEDVDFSQYDVTIRFNPTQGYLDPADDETVGLDIGTSVDDFPTPYRSGYTFEGWELNGMIVTEPFAVNTSVEMEALWSRNEGTVTLLLNPGQGTWPAGTSYSFSGEAGFQLQSLPSPVRTGYVFTGWTLNGAPVPMPITVADDKMLIATWAVCTNPTPSPSATPAPCPTATPAPCPTASPTPAPSSSSTPAPCPTTPAPSARPNPVTSPLAVSFGIFGAVVLGGLSFVGIAALSKKHAVAVGRYNTEATRHKRERRLTDMVDGE